MTQLQRELPPALPHIHFRSPSATAHLTPAQRAELGRQARRAVPRSEHARYEPAADRPDPVALLEQQAATRVPELVPVRYARMLNSPFAFFRGGALIMVSDLAGTPTSGIGVQTCGDAHLSNFGVFASPERHLVFDLNDFDETLPGPWEWDVKRLAASLQIASQGNACTDADARRIVLGAVAEYRRAMNEFAHWQTLQVWYASLRVGKVLSELRSNVDPDTARRAAKAIAKAKTRDHMQAFAKLVRVVDGEPRFISDPPFVVPIEELMNGSDANATETQVRSALRHYHSSLGHDKRRLLEQFRLVQLARKVVGVGSVGTRAWVLLLLGRDSGDPLILQMKEAQPSVLEAFAGHSNYANAGQRVVVGQRIMQASGDILLGWERFAGFDDKPRDFYVRQLRDWKGSIEIEQMAPAGMNVYGRLCGWTLARAHARSGDRIAIAAYLGNSPRFDQAIADFAAAYAEQNRRDLAALISAVASGRVQAASPRRAPRSASDTERITQSPDLGRVRKGVPSGGPAGPAQAT
jgi:uncharacterized protein (DUF2252 family)